MEIARLCGAVKRYGPVTALNGLDLTVRSGEVLALLGPNGAGKTTAISLLLGLAQPDEGEALLFDRPPSDVAARRGVGVMVQEGALPMNLTVREHIIQACAYYPAPLAVEEAIAFAGVGPIADRRYGKLSGGQKRQAQFAVALCGRPQLLFLDEPTANLDTGARQALWATLRRLVAEGVSIVLTTHYIEEAEALADRVVVIAKGRCIASGTVDEMRKVVVRKDISCFSAIDAQSVKAWPDVDDVRGADGRLVVTASNAEAVTARLLAADPDLTDLQIHRAGLAEAIVKLTEEHAA